MSSAPSACVAEGLRLVGGEEIPFPGPEEVNWDSRSAQRSCACNLGSDDT